jgi:hypothetical protein
LSSKYLSTQELELQLQRIKADASSRTPPVHGAGVFTTLDRETWADIRSTLIRNHQNKEIFEEIEKCFMVNTQEI